jgi:hypothetical protein
MALFFVTTKGSVHPCAIGEPVFLSLVLVEIVGEMEPNFHKNDKDWSGEIPTGKGNGMVFFCLI